MLIVKIIDTTPKPENYPRNNHCHLFRTYPSNLFPFHIHTCFTKMGSFFSYLRTYHESFTRNKDSPVAQFVILV